MSIPVPVRACISIIVVFLSSCDVSTGSNSISGIVVDQNGGLDGAVVRIQTTEIQTITDAEGKFKLEDTVPGATFSVTAWKNGYYIAGQTDVKTGMTNIEIHLERHSDSDNPDYDWLPSLYHPGEGENQGCAECHSNNNAEVSYTLPVDEWLLDSHAQSAVNPRFLSMYNGTDVYGNQSPLTRYEYSRDYGTFPLVPDPNKPYYGPGYKLDFPDTHGNCAACHTPAASVNKPYEVDPSTVTGVAVEGIPCDFCHKIWDVKLNNSGMPNENMPGVLSYEFLRPSHGHQLFIGPLDDVAPGEDTYSPLQKQSQFCAPCHFSTFWDTVIYNSYGEWLDSEYNDPANGKQCQDCHMPPLGNDYFAIPDKGGLKRDPDTIFSHQMPGAASESLLRNSVTMELQAEKQEDQVHLSVTITNDQVGHHVPTDSPMRHLILLVDAVDASGSHLTQLTGPITPDWVGIGDPAHGYYAGLPGKTYAKVLMERWSQISPTASYWNPTEIISDNRLAAFETDSSRYSFKLPEDKPVSISATLIFRRAFIDLAEEKGWDLKDIVMEEENLHLP